MKALAYLAGRSLHPRRVPVKYPPFWCRGKIRVKKVFLECLVGYLIWCTIIFFQYFFVKKIYIDSS